MTIESTVPALIAMLAVAMIFVCVSLIGINKEIRNIKGEIGKEK